MKSAIPIVPNGEHARFCDNITQIRSIEAVGQLDNCLIVNLSALVHGGGVDLEDFQTSLLVGKRNLDLPVKSTWPEKSRIEGVWPVRCHNKLNLAEGVETIHLI